MGSRLRTITPANKGSSDTLKKYWLKLLWGKVYSLVYKKQRIL